MKKIIKAEILWSRICSLHCDYCAMVTGREVKKDMNLWKQGVDQLKKLHCKFVAIYGAEPLMDFEGLPEFIKYLAKKNILMTLITNCCVSNLREKLNILYKSGLRSLSVSYDGDIKYSKSIRAKANQGLETIYWFKNKYQDLRDVACIGTANRKNFKTFPKLIEQFTKDNIWFLFDFIHNDRFQYGSKCKNSPLTNELLFKPSDMPEIVKILIKIKKLKDKGCLIHTSYELLNTLIMNPQILLMNGWHCLETGFPSWITIDNDGEVYCCDDFHPKEREKIYFWEIYNKFDKFTKLWKEYVKQCPGCFWNTHFDANRIKMEIIDFKSYVHQ
jgi:MoaA/NifB/PqqE/SkfB family radical SAM enzyme